MVIAHHGPDNAPIHVEANVVRLVGWHMAVDTVLAQRFAKFAKFSASIRLMATNASFREQREIPSFQLVRIVAIGAPQMVALLKALALF